MPFLLFLLLCVPAYSAPAGLFDPVDNRVYMRDETGDDYCTKEYLMDLGKSVCFIVRETDIAECNQTGTVYLPCHGVDLRMRGTLSSVVDEKYVPAPCSDIRFGNDMTAYGATGFLVGDDLVMTASHVVHNMGVGASGLVCLFQVLDYASPAVCPPIGIWSHHASWKYFRVASLYTDFAPTNRNTERDIALLRLERCASKEGIKTLSVIQDNNPLEIVKGKELFTIGHSMGLPQMFCDGAAVNSNVTASQMGFGTDNTKFPPVSSFGYYLFANLDIMPGNSGSPVFIKDNNYSYKVIGVVTNGNDEYQIDYPRNCMKEDWISETEYTNNPQANCTILNTFQDLNFSTSNFICPAVETKCGGVVTYTEPIYGEKICATVPTNMNNGRVLFVDLGLTNGRRYALPGSQICVGIACNYSYDFTMYSLDGNYLGSLNRKGTAGCGQVIGTKTISVGSASVEVIYMETPTTTPTNLSFVAESRLTGNIPLVTSFKPYYPPNWEVLSFQWNYGDGSVGTQQFPVHKYILPGSYYVTLTVQYRNPGYMPQTVQTATYTSPDMVSVAPMVESLNSLNCTVTTTSSLVVGVSDETVVNNVGVVSTGSVDIEDGTSITVAGPGSVTIQAR